MEPRWVVSGGCVLAFLSAAVNAGFLMKLGTSVSHLTGDISKVGLAAASGGNWTSSGAIHLFVAALGFVAGATASGFFIHHPTIEISRPYGRAVTSIGILLLMGHWLITPLPVLAIAFAGIACGLQNALATHYRGMILRTTHVTGLLTDFGTNLGMRLKGHEIPRWKLLVPMMLVGGFFTGALFGAFLTRWLPSHFLLTLGSMYVAGGLSWSFYKRFLSRGEGAVERDG